MYIVKIINNGVVTEIHNKDIKLLNGSIVKGINTIDSFTFTILPSNPAFYLIHDYATIVQVYNTRKQQYEFYGRVLYSSTEMNDAGLILKSVTCENYFGYLCDSQQDYVVEKNWTVRELLTHIIATHNELLEKEKQFIVDTIEVEDPNDNLYCGIQRENTWETIKKKLLDVLGGEIRFRVENGNTYIDYLNQIGEAKTTEIALSKNMKAITRERDPSELVTRLIPLGCKVTNSSEETEDRIDITSVNNGKKYIDDTDAISRYGIRVSTIEFDDVTKEDTLLAKGKEWLAENNKILVKYSITALDLSLLGLDIDDFEVGNTHPIKNSLLGIDDTARIIKKTIDINDETKSTIEVGDKFKSLTEIEIDRQLEEKAAIKIIQQSSGNYILKTDTNQVVKMVNDSTDPVKLTDRLVVESTNFEMTEDGTIVAKAGYIGDCILSNGKLITKTLETASDSSSTYFVTVDKYGAFMWNDSYHATIVPKHYMLQNKNTEDFIYIEPHRIIFSNVSPIPQAIIEFNSGVATFKGDWNFENGITLGATSLTESQLIALLNKLN